MNGEKPTLSSVHGILHRLLRKNRNQHRRGRYYGELDRVSRALKTFVQRASMQSLQRSQGGGDAGQILVNVSQLERLGSLVAKSASTVTSLLARTHFMPFSLVVLTVLARLRILVAHELSESVQKYNATAHSGPASAARPEFLRLDWKKKAFAVVSCHFADKVSPKNEVETGALDVGRAVVAMEDDDLEEERERLAMIDDQNPNQPRQTRSAPHRQRKPKPKPKREKVTAETEREARDDGAALAPKIDPMVEDPSSPPRPPSPETKDAFISVASTSVGAPREAAVVVGRAPRLQPLAKREPQAEIDDIFSQLSGMRSKKKKKKKKKKRKKP